ncbi:MULTISPECIES: hypothetical protein [Acinetobacter]|uniref:Uncharacterized protein n=2 Tax=Acinetobacter TaxID=469 RepID=A0A4Q7ANY8_9GAMM|nr:MULTISPECIES: hypothetical protein [Acinetobacter]MCW8041344.1 hypothetical protein [Acinetobacter entericus]RZG63668.1 hypothetical protein EXE25_18910 [Acinetobacter bouvetii]
MLLQVDDVVINTDKIRLIKINDKANYVMVIFDENHSKKVSFPHAEDMERFLAKIGRKDFFA